MFNNVYLTGRLTKEIELKRTKNDLATTNFSIAVEDGYGDNKKTYFINCVAWRHSAEFLNQYAMKGDLIGVSGRLTTRNYEKDNGEKVYITEVVCDKAEIFPRSKEKSEVVYRKDIDTNASFKQQTLTGDDRGVDGFKEPVIETDNLPFY